MLFMIQKSNRLDVMLAMMQLKSLIDKAVAKGGLFADATEVVQISQSYNIVYNFCHETGITDNSSTNG